MNLEVEFSRDVVQPNYLTMLLLKYFRPRKIEWTPKRDVVITEADLVPPIGTLKEIFKKYKEYRGVYFEWFDFTLRSIELEGEERKRIPSLILADKLQ